MFTFGEQLYRTTIRDEQTLIIEPYLRTFSASIAAAAAVGIADLPVHIDRCLFIHSFTLNGNAAALSTWSEFNLSAVTPQGVQAILFANTSPLGLVPDGQVAIPAAGNRYVVTRVSGLLLPPGISIIRASAARINTTNATSFDVSLNGYLIPPGGIGRA